MGMMKRGKMMKKIMAVYDADSRYADRLAEFVNQRSQVPFQVVAFTSLEKLKEFAAREKIDLLLAGSGERRSSLTGSRQRRLCGLVRMGWLKRARPWFINIRHRTIF
ncbi:MAG: hypothetical protein V8S58_16740 [Lachnospiraceae bacterium]